MNELKSLCQIHSGYSIALGYSHS